LWHRHPNASLHYAVATHASSTGSLSEAVSPKGGDGAEIAWNSHACHPCEWFFATAGYFPLTRQDQFRAAASKPAVDAGPRPRFVGVETTAGPCRGGRTDLSTPEPSFSGRKHRNGHDLPPPPAAVAGFPFTKPFHPSTTSAHDLSCPQARGISLVGTSPSPK